MDSVILILVELGALFNYLIGEEDFPQREHFGSACIFISGLFQVRTFFPAVVAEASVPAPQLPGLLLAGPAAPSPPQWASQDFALVMPRFGSVFPRSRRSKPSAAGRAGRGAAAGSAASGGRAGGDAVQGLSTGRLLVPATQAVLLWDFPMHPGVPVPDSGTRVLGSHKGVPLAVSQPSDTPGVETDLWCHIY